MLWPLARQSLFPSRSSLPLPIPSLRCSRSHRSSSSKNCRSWEMAGSSSDSLRFRGLFGRFGSLPVLLACATSAVHDLGGFLPSPQLADGGWRDVWSCDSRWPSDRTGFTTLTAPQANLSGSPTTLPSRAIRQRNSEKRRFGRGSSRSIRIRAVLLPE
jgi:hypothetical protein